MTEAYYMLFSVLGDGDIRQKQNNSYLQEAYILLGKTASVQISRSKSISKKLCFGRTPEICMILYQIFQDNVHSHIQRLYDYSPKGKDRKYFVPGLRLEKE